ncbi:hypothetical protein EJ04DRAFT_172610 [Polyplosphaeria fusca]|uniref:Uncharacterized protein n=1 Tax=Polyplosphaeria fusca TaxID=682080 RepID=A0A9P4R3V3_9PLEO|nr:hypothetical protein EJ04DRAFT_172610 [Polyplosphaeria fusca]
MQYIFKIPFFMFTLLGSCWDPVKVPTHDPSIGSTVRKASMGFPLPLPLLFFFCCVNTMFQHVESS